MHYKVVTTNGFALNQDKILQIYFCVKHQAKNDFLKYVESIVDLAVDGMPSQNPQAP